MTMACKLQLPEETQLEAIWPPHLHEHKDNWLRSGFMPRGLFSPIILNA